MAAVTLKETTKTKAAEELGVSWTHLLAVLDGERAGSAGLQQGIADYVGIARSKLFPQAESPAA